MIHYHPILFAFGFGNVLALGFLAAAAAPILIHLWSRRKFREMPWAAMDFLLAAVKKNARRLRIEQWLLLAVRTLLVIAVVLAVAQPYLEQLGLGFVAGQRTLKVLVIDGSYSMAYKPTDKSRFERAKQLAAQIVDESSQGDAFMLVLMAAPPAVVVGTPAIDAKDFVAEIENLKLPHGGGDLEATLLKVEEILKTAESSSLSRREIYFITDLGRTSWTPDLTGQAAEEFQKRVDLLANRAELVVVDVGQAGGENLAVTSLRVAEPFVTIAHDVTLEAQVRNFGAQPRNHHLVELLVDGRRAKEAYVNVAPGEQAAVTFTHRFEAPGEHVIEARLGPDLLEIDNHRWLAVPVKENVRVLLVDGKPAGGGLSGATDYLVLALNPTAGREVSRGLVRPEVIAESSLLERDLAHFDCIVLANVGQFTASEAKVLESYLKQGGGVIVFLGDQVLPERYNRELTAPDGVHVLPARLKELVAEARYRFDPLDYRHPLVRIFNGQERSGLITTPVYRYYRLDVPADSKSKVALAFEGGDPAIVEEPIGRGRSILVATEGSLSSIDPATKSPWTTMPSWPSFVPIVQELLSLAVSGQWQDRNVEVGQPLGEMVTSATVPSTLALHTPDGRSEQLRLVTDAAGRRWSFAETLYSGMYTADYGTSGDQQENFAVNVDTVESNLARCDATELPRQFTAHKRSDLDETASQSIGRRAGLHKMLLYSALSLLFLETFLAWRAGQAR